MQARKRAPRAFDRRSLRRERPRRLPCRSRRGRRVSRRGARARGVRAAAGTIRGDPSSAVRRRRLRAQPRLPPRTLATARKLARAKVTVVFGAGGKRDRAKRAPMGEAARDADRVVLTSDNPRDEDPSAIADAIAEGLSGHPAVERELDRAAAI